MTEDFKFDIGEDYSPSKDGFLIPVYFDIDVLYHFFYSSKYHIIFSSESYMTLTLEETLLPLGINKNKKVIAWLGDLQKLTSKEKHLFLASNINSEHDIESDFKKAQLGTMFSSEIKEVTIFRLLYKINDLIKTHFSFKLWNLPDTNLLKVFKMCSNYKTILFSNESDFKRIISELNEEIIEPMIKDNLQSHFNNNNIGFDKKFGSLKLFNQFLECNSLNKNNLISPIFYLYDLRIWADHRDGSEYIDNVKSKLELKQDCSFEELYKALINKLYLNLNELFRILTLRGLD